MAFAQSPSTSELYFEPEEVEQYHAFTYLIPVLLCIMLWMSLHWFYLWKRASALSYPPQLPPTPTETPSSLVTSVCEVGRKEDLIDKFPTKIFDEELKARDSVCCVCLGEFEIKEESIELSLCKHIFHKDCISNWLISNTTCPLCRCSVMVVDNTKFVGPPPPHTSPAELLHVTASI